MPEVNCDEITDPVIKNIIKNNPDPGKRREALRKHRRELQNTKVQRILQEIRHKDNMEYIAGGDAEQRLNDMISGTRQSAGGVSLERRIDAIHGEYYAEMADAMETFKSRWGGLARNKEKQRDLIRYIFNKSGDADPMIKAYGDSWLNVTRKIRDRFNRAGGDIGFLQEFNLQTPHDSSKLDKLGFDKWYESIRTKVDLEHIFGKGYERTPEQQKNVFKGIFESIRTEGASKVDTEALTPNIKRKIGNRHQESRILHFKDGDGWLEYVDEFGQPDYSDAMMGYIERMSREIGAMEVLGPDPDIGFETLLKNVQAKKGKKYAGRMAKNSYDNVMGRAMGAKTPIGEVLGGLRNLQTGTKLGFAPLSALSDSWYSAVTSVYNGVPAFKVFKRQLMNLNPANKEDRVLANKLGIVADYALNRVHVANRFGEVTGYGVTSQYADFMVRASGLNAWTQGSKIGFALEFSAELAKRSIKDFDQIDGGLKRAFERYGIDEKTWNAMRKGVTEDRGMKYIDATKITSDDVKAKFVGMIKEEMGFAVPEPNAKTRGVMNQGIPTGTIAGEMIRTATQFKTFGVSMLMSHGMRALDRSAPLATRLGYAIPTIAGSAAIGMGILQLKEIAKGKEPLPWDLKLATKGFAQGGALGPMGDLVFNDQSKFGGLPAYMAGPTIGDMQKLYKFAMGTAQDVVEVETDWADKSRKAVAGIIGEVQKGLPIVGDAWYSRLMMDRLVMDWTNQQLDKDWHMKQRALRRKMAKDEDRGHWTEPTGKLGF